MIVRVACEVSWPSICRPSPYTDLTEGGEAAGLAMDTRLVRVALPLARAALHPSCGRGSMLSDSDSTAALETPTCRPGSQLSTRSQGVRRWPHNCYPTRRKNCPTSSTGMQRRAHRCSAHETPRTRNRSTRAPSASTRSMSAEMRSRTSLVCLRSCKLPPTPPENAKAYMA